LASQCAAQLGTGTARFERQIVRGAPKCTRAEKFLQALDFGGVEGDRTLDLRIANATLSQLSYHPGIADCRARILP
jgi:hypothetical protein